MVLLFRTAVGVPLKVSLRVCVEAISWGFILAKECEYGYLQAILHYGVCFLWSSFQDASRRSVFPLQLFLCDVCMWSRGDDRSKGIDYKLARSMKVENIFAEYMKLQEEQNDAELKKQHNFLSPLPRNLKLLQS